MNPIEKAAAGLNSAELSRRDFLRHSLMAAAGVVAGGAMTLPTSASAAGIGPIEKPDLTIGFIPLTDCASVVMASELGLFKKYGLNVTVSKEASWAAVRDKLVLGQLDAAHVLYGLVYGVHLGIGGPKKDMAVLMNLNYNGQAITLSNKLKEEGATTGESLKKLVAQKKREYTFAQTFPTGTHAMWLYYWLSAHGIDPMQDVKTIVIPPPQMVANMRVGNMDGYCVGEPWNARAVFDKIGFTATTTQGIWKNHPEKVLGTTKEFVTKYPNTAKAMICAVLEASKHIDAMANRAKVSEIIGGKSYVNAPPPVILGRMQGKYEDGLGKTWQDPDYMKFFMDGEVNFPYLSHGAWFLTQHRRWGLLKQDIDYVGVAKQINQIELYTDAAKSLGVAVPTNPLKTETLFDGTVFDPSKAAAYASGFAIKA
ncbi:nitrate ABC transporter substrate-binding protein [Solimonas sp. K1W22B-7]|uniref:CmpA/NrtA family ABC transporter substrate-binding protein n=1 Tax=Solimonas sp. K1W22B-7 TaxID=2303331 RepID=UPI000E336C91|nr:CmpA/NrtA family ABC transporter substrate-binding protein [Solimonas sp. K1W22B-7]AXQ28416.1 nitrate ABC transporter substrate-binding protein [Solimonas sp. K1W22B-7]